MAVDREVSQSISCILNHKYSLLSNESAKIDLVF